MNTKLLVDVAERTIATYLETFIGLLIAGTVIDVSTAKAAAVAAIPAGLAIIKGALAGFLAPSTGAAVLPKADA